MATWHSYTKLRMHTTHTITSLRSQTKELGSQLRLYTNKLCPEYKTKPLPGEAAAANRRRAATGKKASTLNAKSSARNISDTFKKFNLKTYKIHALGDYADNIEQFGPTDCFSTQQVCRIPLETSSSPHHHLLNRVNSNIGELRGSTSEPTRCVSSVRLRNKSGWNIITANTLPRFGQKRAPAQHLGPVYPQSLLKTCHHNTTTRSRRGIGIV